MKNTILLIFSMMIISIHTFAQHTLKGKISNKEGAPISRATIIIENSGYTTVSDTTGDFTIQKLGIKF